MITREFKKDKLTVKIMDSRLSMGEVAAADAAAYIKELQATKDELNIIFAAAPSQNETLAALVATEGIEWNKINAFHMDEYIGLPKDAPQGFGNFLARAIFDLVPFKSVNYLAPDANDPEATCKRYTELLKAHPVDMIMMGIGENGHIAFNDPPVADFKDTKLVKIVELDPICRQQQVNDGCFASLDLVPTHALSLTIPVFMKAKKLICSVPAPTKADAVYATCNNEEINEKCPATVMRLHNDATMYLDPDSAAKL